MYCYPNFIPLPGQTVERIAGRLKELTFTRLYDAFNRIINEDAEQKIHRSAARYVEALNGRLFST